MVFDPTISRLTVQRLTALSSTYHTRHSFETEIIKILEDFCNGINNKQLTILMSLDVSAAYDIICHSILLQHGCDDFDVRGVALKWIDSYASNGQQFVNMGTDYTLYIRSTAGICYQTVAFVAYMSPIAVISSHGMLFHRHADNKQLCVAANTKVDTADALKILTSCTHAFQSWFLLNDQHLNSEKSEVMIIGMRAEVVAGTFLKLRENVKSLGVTFNRKLAFE